MTEQPDEEVAYRELEDFIRHMARMLVDKPNEVVIRAAKGPRFIAFQVDVAESDAGALIGTRGKHADAMRTLLQAAGAVYRVQVNANFASRDRDALPPR